MPPFYKCTLFWGAVYICNVHFGGWVSDVLERSRAERSRSDEDIAAILGLTPIQRQQIFTINALNNREGRSYFKEVWICRGQNSDVYGVEEAPECYWAYTTERTEKEALKLYLAHYGTMQEAITHIEADRKRDGGHKYLEFARKVNQHQKVMSLWSS